MQQNPADIRVRQAAHADLPAIERLLQEAGLPLDGLETQFGPAYAVAESEGRVVGAEGIEVYGEYGLLRSAVVEPSWQGLGIGQALTQNRLAWARQQGLKAVYLLTTTAADYFPKFGFTATTRAEAPAELQASVEFACACPLTAVVMALSLQGM